MGGVFFRSCYKNNNFAKSHLRFMYAYNMYIEYNTVERKGQ